MKRILLLCLLLFSTAAFATHTEDAVSLRGIPAFHIVCSEVGDKYVKHGLTSDKVIEAAEAALKKAGIAVTDSDDSPEMYIHIVLMTPSAHPDLVAYSLETEFRQAAALARDPSNKIVAGTWATREVGTMGIAESASLVDDVTEQVGEFITDYKANNK